MKKKSFISKFKNVITSVDFTCGFKRMNIAFLTIILCFTLLCLFDCLPTANALVVQQDDFHTIDGCWYSLTPSTLGSDLVQYSGDMPKNPTNAQKNKYTKYCYTLVNDESKIYDKNSYQYIVNENDEVYVFEYYTWLDSTTTDTKKIAVYSQTGLKQNKDINGKLYYSFANGSNGQYVFDTVDDYLYYRLYRYLPDWQTNDTVYYSQDDKLSFDDNEYFGYKLLNDDIYNTYKNVDVYTEYKFAVGDTNYIRYSNISVDANGNIIAGTSGSTDTSEYQVINRSDLNQLTYVLETKGDAYVTTDVNGKQIGTNGFSTKMYYAGGQMYIYDENFQIDTPSGKQTVSGFKIYSILTNEAATLIDYSNFDINKYTMIRFDEATNELIVEAERYYDLYEITYELVQNVTSTNETNKDQEYINKQEAEVNCEVTNNGISQYKLTYNYAFNLRNDYQYKVTYKQKYFTVRSYKHTGQDTEKYQLVKVGSNVSINTGDYAGGSYTNFASSSRETLSNNYQQWGSNAEYYEYLRTEYTANANLHYNSADVLATNITNSVGNGSVTSYTWTAGSTANVVYTSDVSATSHTARKYYLDNGVVKYQNDTRNFYYVGGKYYTEKGTTWRYGYNKPYTISKKTFSNVTSLPSVTNTSSSLSLNTSSYYNATANSTYTYGRSYTSSTTVTPNASTYSYHNFPYSTSSYYSYLGYSSSNYSNLDTKIKSFGTSLSDLITYSYDYSTCKITFTPKYSYTTKSVASMSDGDYYYTLKLGCTYVSDTDDTSDWTCEVYNTNKTGGLIPNGNYYSVKVYYYTSSGSTTNMTINGNSRTALSTYLGAGCYPYAMYVYIPLEYCESYSYDTSSEDFRYYYLRYQVNWTKSTKYSGSYYECKFGTTSASKLIQTSKLSSTFALNSTTGSFSFNYSSDTTMYYQYKGTTYSQTAETITYSKGVQKTGSGSTDVYSKNRTVIPVIDIPITGLTSTSIYPLTNAQITEIKNKVIAQATNYSEITLYEPTVDANTGKITVTGYISQAIKAYRSDNAATVSLGTVTYYFTGTAAITQTPGSVPVTSTNYYNTYKISKTTTTGSFTKTSTISDAVSTVAPKIGSETSTTYGDFERTENTSTTQTYVKSKYKYISDSVVGTSWGTNTYTAYSNTNGANTSGTNYSEVCGPNGQGAFTIPNSTYWSSHTGKVTYGLYSVVTNTDVGQKVNFTETFTVPYSTGKSDQSQKEGSYAYYETVATNKGYDVNKIIDVSVVTSLPTANIKEYYNITIKRYSFTSKEVGKEYTYGTTSSNFGLSNINVSSYYNNISYDNNGKMTSGTWNGSYTLPTSYNLFDETTFFDDYNKEMRVSTSNGITTYTLYNTLNLVSAIQAVATKMGSTQRDYYISYYYNGTLKTQTITGSSKLLNNFNVNFLKAIGSNTSSGYTISRIMVTTNSSKSGVYSKYADISVNQINNKDDYSEKVYVYNYNLDYVWRETNIKATATITNLNSLIDANGKWIGTTPTYQYTLNGKSFTYSGNTINYARGNEYYFDDSTRMVYKSKNPYFGYYLTKNIVITESELGSDYYNITQALENGENITSNPELAKQGIDGFNYYNYFSIHEPTITNTKNATIKINAEHFATGNYVSKNSTVGKLALYFEKIGELQDIYLVYNRINGTYKLIKASKVTNYKYEVYYDANKETTDGGLTFTYGDAGFVVEDGEFLQLRKNSNGKPVKDANGNYIYDTIYRSSLVENVNGTLDNLISNGINNYTGTLVSNGKTSTTITSNNVVDKLVNPSDALLMFGSTNIIDSTDTTFNYNGYTEINGTEQTVNSSKYKQNDNNYLLLLETTIDNGTESSPITVNGVTYDGYLKAYYQSSAGDMYRLRDDSSTLYSSYGEDYIPKFTRYKQYIIEGRWQKTNLEDYYYQTGDNMPDEVSKILYSTANGSFLNKQWNLGNGAYLGKVGSVGSEYDGLLIGQDINMAVIQDENGNYVYKYYNDKENSNFGTKAIIDDKFSSNYLAEYLIQNKTNSFPESVIGETVTTNTLLVKKDKVKLYSLTQKIPYNLVTIVEDENIDKLSTLDMRYQFNATSFMKDLKNNTDAPIYIKADNLDGVFQIKSLEYDIPSNIGYKHVENISLYNGTMAINAQQGIIKPGIFTTTNGKKYVEMIYYNGYMYQLGGIVGDDSMNLSNDFTRYANEMKMALAAIIVSYAEQNPNKAHDAVGLVKALAGDYYDKNNWLSNTVLNIFDSLGYPQEADKTEAITSNLFTSNLFKVTLDLEGIDYEDYGDVDVVVGGMSYYEKIIKAIKVEPTQEALNKMERSSDYIRIGDACYYKTQRYETFNSYRGVDVALDNADLVFEIYDVLDILTFQANSFSLFYTLMMNNDSFLANKDNELAYVAYSSLIKDENNANSSPYSKVNLYDIFTANPSINQYFIEAEIGVDASSGDKAQNFNLPFAKVEYTNASESFTSEIVYTETGIHFYNLGGRGSEIRYILTDNPYDRVMTTAAGWFETIMDTFFEPLPFGDAFQLVTEQSEKLKIAYGHNGNSIQLNPMKTESWIGNDAFKLESGKNISSSDDWTTDTKDAFYDACGGNNEKIKDQIIAYQASKYTTKTSNFIYSVRSVGEQNYVMKYAQYNAELPWFSDATNWMGNTQQFFQDVANTVGNALATAWKWLWSGGEDTHSPEEDGYFQGTDHFAMTFYQLPTYENPELVKNEFQIYFDEDAPRGREYNYTIIEDDDYSLSTSFNITIENLSTTSTGGKFWGFELISTNAPKASNKFNGWKWNGSNYVYVYDKRLSSRNNINLILQEGTEDNKITISNLPAGYKYEIVVYSGKSLIEETYYPAKFSSNINNSNGSLEALTGSIRFKTGPNLVYNPYNTTLSDSSSTLNGDKYLAENKYIDYEIQQFIYNANNVNDSSYTSGTVSFKHPLTQEIYKFSSNLLMHKYLNTENVSKIAFYLKASGVTYTTTSQYMVWDISNGKTVAKGKFDHSDDAYKGESYLSNVILYDLTDADKLVLQNSYNNVIDTSFINNYLLKDKLVFHVKNTGGSTLETNIKFEILWQPYYEETLAYLDLNQNGEYDKAVDVRPTVSGSKLDYYNESAMAINSEMSTETRVEYDHLIYGSSEVGDYSKWKQAKFTITKVSANSNTYLHPFEISYTNENGVSENGWYQLCIIKDGESHIIK